MWLIFARTVSIFPPKPFIFFILGGGGGGGGAPPTKSTHLRVLWAFKRNYAYAPLAHKNEDKITKNI